MIGNLRAFSNTEYRFSGISIDDDSESLITVIDSELQAAGWKRVSGACNLPSFNMDFNDAKQYCVSEALNDGIRISIEYPDGLDGLKALADNAPQYAKAALALDGIIFSNTFPAPEHINTVSVSKGNSKIVSISIGRKQ